MKKLYIFISGIALIILIFGMGLLDNAQRIDYINEQSSKDAYKYFVSNGYIDKHHEYYVNQESVNEDGIVTVYKVIVKEGGHYCTYYYEVE